MRNILIVVSIFTINSCIEGEVLESDVNTIEFTYRGLYEEEMGFLGYKAMVLTDISVEKTEEEITETERVKVLNILGIGNDESLVNLRVYADSVGENLIFNGAFNVKTPPIGVPYDYFDGGIDFTVLVNNDEEFIAEFSGQMRHFVLYYNEYRYLNIRSGTINYKY